MKKKLLLIALPALLVMSSCTSLRASGTVVNDLNPFKEAAEANTELFADNDEGFELKKMPYRMSSEDDFVEPKIGVQYKPRYEKVEDSGEWFVAVRFLAAVGTLDVDAEWTRDIYKTDGTKYTSTVQKATTKAYAELNGGAGVGTVRADDEIKEGTVNETPYNYYVVYTIYDIPEEDFDNYYIVAHLKISDPAGVHADGYSKAMAARIGGGATAKFDKGQTGCFLAGTINGTPNSIVAKDAVTSEGDNARFTVPLAANDSFVVVNNIPAESKFLIYNYSNIEDGGASASFTSDNLKIKASIARVFVLYLNSSGHIWTDIAPELYVNGVNTAYNNIRYSGSDKVNCTVEGLHTGDEIRFKIGEDYLHFYYTDGSDLDVGDSYEIPADGNYTFYVTSSNKVFYSPVYYRAELTFDFSAVTSWADNFKIHAWNEIGSIGTWGESDESIVDGKYTLFSVGKITQFIVYFRDKGTSITKESTTINYGFANGHSYSITVSPADWGSNENANRFYSGVNVVDTTV